MGTELLVERDCFLHRGNSFVFKLSDPQFGEAGAHAALVREEKAGSCTNAGKPHFLRYIGDAADRDIGLVGYDAVNLFFARISKDRLLVADIDDQAVRDVRVKSPGDYRGCEQNLAGFRGLLHQRKLEITCSDDQKLFAGQRLSGSCVPDIYIGHVSLLFSHKPLRIKNLVPARLLILVFRQVDLVPDHELRRIVE